MRSLYPEGAAAVVSPLTGIVRQVVEFPVAATDPAVFTTLATVSRPARLGTGLAAVPGAGVGLTAEAARWSAIGEALERYASSWIDRRRLLFGSREELDGGRRLAAPGSFALFHREQHAAAVDGGAGRWPFAPFDDATRVAWVAGRSLADGGETWVPAALTFLPYSPRFDGEKLIAYPTSNGLACGRSLEEATLAALCEAIERDALMLLWRRRRPAPRLHRFVDTRLDDHLASRLARPGLDYTLVDMTTDLRLPARLAIAVDRSASPPMIVVGADAGLDPEAADLGAVLEAAHALKWMREQPAGSVRVPATAEAIESFEDHTAYYAYGDHAGAFDFLLAADAPADDWPATTPTVPRDLAGLAAHLAERRLEPVMVDLTTEDVAAVGLHVVRVVVPGLQPIEGPHRFRFLGGHRLYEALGASGEAPTSPTELNHDPHPLP